jgi:hypothetical protein
MNETTIELPVARKRGKRARSRLAKLPAAPVPLYKGRKRRKLLETRKAIWTRERNRSFVLQNGYSTVSNSACGGRRNEVLTRDGHKCVQCGMTDARHKEKWGRPITVDHKDKNRKNNSLENLQTLCLELPRS